MLIQNVYDPTARTCLEWSPQEASGEIHPLGTHKCSNSCPLSSPLEIGRGSVQLLSGLSYHAGSARTARAAAVGLKMGLP